MYEALGFEAEKRSISFGKVLVYALSDALANSTWKGWK